MPWTFSTLENQWVCFGCGYMKPGHEPSAEHDCTAVAEAAPPPARAADDADAIHQRIKELRP